MNKTALILGGVLAVLLVVQTWRVHALQRSLETNRAALSKTTAVDGILASGSSAVEQGSAAAVPDKPVVLTEPAGEFAESGSEALARLQTWGERRAAKNDRDGQNSSAAKNGEGSTTPSKQKKPEANSARERDMTRDTIAKARRLALDGDYDSAITTMRQAVESQPANAQYYRELAKLYNDLGMLDEALQVYQDWASARPEDAQAYYSLASMYDAMGMNEEALSYLRRYEEANAGSPDGYASIASLYRRLGMPDEEYGALAAWVDAAPNSSAAALALADYYRRSGNYSAATPQYQQAIAMAPGNVSAHVNLALAYQQMGQHQAAQGQLLYALDLHPGDASIWMRLGESYRRSGDMGAALSAYQTVLGLEPSSAFALRAGQQIVRIQRQMSQQPKSGTMLAAG